MSADVDDYALTRVPAGQRHGWWSVGMQRFGQISALSQFLLGATLGFGMTFWSAFWALTLGAVILELVCILVRVILRCRAGGSGEESAFRRRMSSWHRAA